jgi:hypothetical protein
MENNLNMLAALIRVQLKQQLEPLLNHVDSSQGCIEASPTTCRGKEDL